MPVKMSHNHNPYLKVNEPFHAIRLCEEGDIDGALPVVEVAELQALDEVRDGGKQTPQVLVVVQVQTRSTRRWGRGRGKVVVSRGRRGRGRHSHRTTEGPAAAAVTGRASIRRGHFQHGGSWGTAPHRAAILATSSYPGYGHSKHTHSLLKF